MEEDKTMIQDHCSTQTSNESFGVQILVATLADGISASRGNSATNLFRFLKTPELRWRLNQKILEQSLQIQFTLEFFGKLVPEAPEQARILETIESSPALQNRNRYCNKWLRSFDHLREIQTQEGQRSLLMNLFCFGICVEGLFSTSALAHLDLLESHPILRPLNRGLGRSLRDPSWQLELALGVSETLKGSVGVSLDARLIDLIEQMIEDAIDCEMNLADEMKGWGLTRLSLQDIRSCLEFKADESLQILKCPPRYRIQRPFLTDI